MRRLRRAARWIGPASARQSRVCAHAHRAKAAACVVLLAPPRSTSAPAPTAPPITHVAPKRCQPRPRAALNARTHTRAHTQDNTVKEVNASLPTLKKNIAKDLWCVAVSVCAAVCDAVCAVCRFGAAAAAARAAPCSPHSRSPTHAPSSSGVPESAVEIWKVCGAAFVLAGARAWRAQTTSAASVKRSARRADRPPAPHTHALSQHIR